MGRDSSDLFLPAFTLCFLTRCWFRTGSASCPCKGRGGRVGGGGEFNIAKMLRECNSPCKSRRAGSFREELLRPFIVKIDAHMSASRPHRCSFWSFWLGRCSLALPASCSPRTYLGFWGGERQRVVWLGQVPAWLWLFIYLFKLSRLRSLPQLIRAKERTLGRRCLHGSCHTVFLCERKNVKLLYNLFLIWVCCSHLFQPSREL